MVLITLVVIVVRIVLAFEAASHLLDAAVSRLVEHGLLVSPGLAGDLLFGRRHCLSDQINFTHCHDKPAFDSRVSSREDGNPIIAPGS